MVKINRDDLDEFTRAYIEAALWSSNDNTDDQGGDPLDQNYDIEDIDEKTLATMVEDCKNFQEQYSSEIVAAPRVSKSGEYSNLEMAGHDFWLTRNRHGVGFWETPNWPKELGKRLTDACHALGEVDLYVGDDKKIHAM